MFRLFSLLIISYFLANRANFDYFTLLLLFFVAVGFYFHLFQKFVSRLRDDVASLRGQPESFGRRLVLAFAYLIAFFLLSRQGLLPDWLIANDVEITGFFLLLFIPILLVMKFQPWVSTLFALLFVMGIPFATLQNHERTSEILAISAFILLLVALCQSLIQKNELLAN